MQLIGHELELRPQRGRGMSIINN